MDSYRLAVVVVVGALATAGMVSALPADNALSVGQPDSPVITIDIDLAPGGGAGAMEDVDDDDVDADDDDDDDCCCCCCCDGDDDDGDDDDDSDDDDSDDGDDDESTEDTEDTDDPDDDERREGSVDVNVTSEGPWAAFQHRDSQDLAIINKDGGTVDIIPVRPNAIGPARYDIDNDGAIEAIYINGHELRTVDLQSGNITTLDASDNVYHAPHGVGDFDEDGTDEIYYIRNGDIWKVAPGESPTEVAGSFEHADNAKGVAGVADVDADDGVEVVYVNSDGEVVYLTGEGEQALTGFDTMAGRDTIGQPRDFDGDGKARIPVASKAEDKHIVLLSADTGETEDITPGADGGLVESRMASFDIDDDGEFEVVFSHKGDNGDLYYVEPSTGEIIEIHTDDGDEVQGKKGEGVA